MITDTRTAVTGLAMTILATLAAILTGDLAVTVLSIAVGLLRLAVAYLRRPRAPHVYRARFAVQAWF